MKLTNIASATFLILSAVACERSYQRVSLNEEYAKGIALDKLVEVENNEKLVADIETDMGMIVIELFSKEAPNTVKNFVGLALQGYYNSLTFHRVIKDFMIQTGDSTGTGEGGKSIYGGEFADEFSYSLRFDDAGVVAMANRGPGTNRSQFFITTAATPWLNRKHTVFGKVIDGMGVVYKINRVKTDRADKPVEKIVMQKINIEKRIYR